MVSAEWADKNIYNCVVVVMFVQPCRLRLLTAWLCIYSSRMWLMYIVSVEMLQIVTRTREVLPKFLRTGTPPGCDNLVVSEQVYDTCYVFWIFEIYLIPIYWYQSTVYEFYIQCFRFHVLVFLM